MRINLDTLDDDAMNDLREHLITPDAPCDPMLRLATHELNREQLTELALQLSLCPLHFIDYAICFDDDEPECAAIRTIHPSHDT